ncbi:MAG: hypothetical protein L6R39_005704 [Caloplaca ligustica]|nr:MAG: hypothetical protein L6R39_005704 [Caloplaca ligustica]
MTPSKPLPFPSPFVDADAYVTSLLSFVTSSKMFQSLCGGVHILEFLTQDPDLYTTLLPEDWRQFFDTLDVPHLLDLLMRIDLDLYPTSEGATSLERGSTRWHSGSVPPPTLMEYIKLIRQHSLDRSVNASKEMYTSASDNGLGRPVAVGMKPKKIHEVARLARYVDHLSSELGSDRSCRISHLVDFGSGQNYLGRALVSAPYERKVIAIESKPLNIDGARSMDVTAKLAKKEVIMRNKKQFRASASLKPTSDQSKLPAPSTAESVCTATSSQDDGPGRDRNIQYLETLIQDGDLSSILPLLTQATPSPNLMVISLHSCGNLLHHGLRSLTLNPCVRAIAMVGCCYNLLTERHPPPARYRESNVRSSHPRLQQTSSAYDPHGFPMSDYFMTYPHSHGPGIRFNITARMMAVQAPQNWTEKECQSFFTRHFYRALFQRMLVDRGIVERRMHSDRIMGERVQEYKDNSQPIILGSLRKQCYTSFTAYVRAAIAKLRNDPVHAEQITRRMQGLTDEEIMQYEKEYRHKKKELSIVWSLMAFSAGVVESAIVVDRWQWLREQKEVKECWVESIFDYSISPRNLIMVGIKA